MSIIAIEYISNKKILFSPLNWGFGHVARSIPILEQLLKQGNTFVVACDENQRKIYEEYFAKLQYVHWQGYPFYFSSKGNFALDLLRSFTKLSAYGRKEIDFVDQYCTTKKIDIVLSDHRYFFRSKRVKSIFITHQISLPLPWYLNMVQGIHNRLINKFDEIWVLDTEEHIFAGKLSCGKTKTNQLFIGPVSRFSNLEGAPKTGTIIIVSGPEPYAKQFYLEQKSKLKTGDKIVYQGKIESLNSVKLITWKELDAEILQAEKIISRSGYSTIMDVHFLKCETELIPTKGQWEQEFLASYMNNPLNDR